MPENTNSCRHCQHGIRFAPLGPDPKKSDWDWVDDRAVRCAVTADGRHFPVTSIEGIDY